MRPNLRSDPVRAGVIGKVLLWVVGIPLLVIVLAFAAILRWLSGGAAHAPARVSDGQAQPPAISQPKGPGEPQLIPQRHGGGIER